MLYNNCELAILVKGKRIDEYPHLGQLFIEGRANSTFEIEFTNRNPFRVEAVISVDGLSILDGKLAGEHSNGYLVDANASIRIPGWRLSNQQVASFVFSGKGESYATQMTGSSANNGVIGVMVFKEKVQQPVYLSKSPVMRGFGPMGTPMFGSGGWGATGTAGDMTFGSVRASSINAGSITSNAVGSGAEAVYAAAQNNLGTGFGEAQSFNTASVSFERADMLAMMVMYYDDRRGLASRGIQIVRPRREARPVAPQAFPGMGCQPPAGWKG